MQGSLTDKLLLRVTLRTAEVTQPKLGHCWVQQSVTRDMAGRVSLMAAGRGSAVWFSMCFLEQGIRGEGTE